MKKPVWRWVSATAVVLMLSQPLLMADEPPQEVQVEIEVTETVQQAAEQAAEAAKAIAAQAAAKAQEKAAELAEEAAAHAQQAADRVVEKGIEIGGLNWKWETPYQLGLHVAPVPKALDVQLKLEGKGILVDSVEKDGAGEHAGIKPHDVVIRVAEQDIKTSADLVKLIRKSEGKALQFDLVRGGEKLTINVQPENVLQLQGNGNVDVAKLPKIEIDEEIIELESKIREKLKGAGVDVRMQVIRPGQVMPADALLKRGELPEGVSISVRKESGKPAKIEVSRGEEKWEATEESLDKLPDDLRPHVAHMLGRGPIGIGFPPNVKFTTPLPSGFTIVADATRNRNEREEVAMKIAGAPRNSELQLVIRRLDELKKDIHRLYEQIDELREDRKKD